MYKTFIDDLNFLDDLDYEDDDCLAYKSLKTPKVNIDERFQCPLSPPTDWDDSIFSYTEILESSEMISEKPLDTETIVYEPDKLKVETIEIISQPEVEKPEKPKLKKRKMKKIPQSPELKTDDSLKPKLSLKTEVKKLCKPLKPELKTDVSLKPKLSLKTGVKKLSKPESLKPELVPMKKLKTDDSSELKKVPLKKKPESLKPELVPLKKKPESLKPELVPLKKKPESLKPGLKKVPLKKLKTDNSSELKKRKMKSPLKMDDSPVIKKRKMELALKTDDALKPEKCLKKVPLEKKKPPELIKSVEPFKIGLENTFQHDKPLIEHEFKKPWPVWKFLSTYTIPKRSMQYHSIYFGLKHSMHFGPNDFIVLHPDPEDIEYVESF